jgi:hypothetical protein
MKPLSDFMIWHSLRILRFAGWCSMAAAGDQSMFRDKNGVFGWRCEQQLFR